MKICPVGTEVLHADN